jgi:hypothetical protein
VSFISVLFPNYMSEFFSLLNGVIDNLW